MSIEPFPEALKKESPNLEDRFWPFLHFLNNESPRGKILISAGLMEEQLKDNIGAGGGMRPVAFLGASPHNSETKGEEHAKAILSCL